MSVRVHIVAARGMSADAFAVAFKDVGEIVVEHGDGWVWFQASVWGVSARELLGRLEGLPDTAMLLTTEDGCGWYLHLRKPGEEPFRIVHEFGVFDEADEPTWEEEEDDDANFAVVDLDVDAPALPPPGPEDRPLTISDDFFAPDMEHEEDEGEDDACSPVESFLEEIRFLGVTLPEEVIAEMDGASWRRCAEIYHRWQTDEILDALHRFGIPHNPEAIVALLACTSVSAGELESDLGNAPRFCMEIGLGQEFAHCVAALEREGEKACNDTEDVEASESRTEPRIAPIADGEEEDEADAMFAALEVKVAEMEGLPHSGEILLERNGRTFWVADTSGIVEALRTEGTAKLLQQSDMALQALGFSSVGEIATTITGPLVLRVFASEAERALAAQYYGAFGLLQRDVFTEFEDDASLTTSNAVMEQSALRRRILVRASDADDWQGLLDEHREGLRRAGGYGLTPRAVPKTLTEVAETLHRFIVRRMG